MVDIVTANRENGMQYFILSLMLSAATGYGSVVMNYTRRDIPLAIQLACDPFQFLRDWRWWVAFVSVWGTTIYGWCTAGFWMTTLLGLPGALIFAAALFYDNRKKQPQQT